MKYIDFKKDRMDYKGALRALEIYYARFGTPESVTVNLAARDAGVTRLEAHFFMADIDGLGMPETRECAVKYLNRLHEIMSATQAMTEHKELSA